MKIIRWAAILTLVACGHPTTSELGSQSPAAPVTNFPGATATALVDGLLASDAPVEPGQSTLPSGSWSVDQLRCNESIMELVRPGGGGFMVRFFYYCVVSDGTATYEIPSAEAEKIIKAFDQDKLASSERGVHRRVWTFAGVDCDYSTKELVVPGGFKVVRHDKCSYVSQSQN